MGLLGVYTECVYFFMRLRWGGHHFCDQYVRSFEVIFAVQYFISQKKPEMATKNAPAVKKTTGATFFYYNNLDVPKKFILS